MVTLEEVANRRSDACSTFHFLECMQWALEIPFDDKELSINSEY